MVVWMGDVVGLAIQIHKPGVARGQGIKGKVLITIRSVGRKKTVSAFFTGR